MKRIFLLIPALAPLSVAAQAIEEQLTQPWQLPQQLTHLQAQINAVRSHFALTDADEGRFNESKAAVRAQEQKFLPSVSGGVNFNRGKTLFYQDGNEKNSPDAAARLQLNVSLRQNIYNGGTDSGKLSVSRKKMLLAELRLVHAFRRHIRAWLKDTAAILHQQKLLSYHSAAAERAASLNRLAKRKEASGFLGRRDLLDSERELLRTEQDSISSRQNLDRMMSRHKALYGTAKVDGAGFKDFEGLRQIKISSSSAAELQPNVLRLLPVRIAALEKSIAADETKYASSGRFSPRLDAAAQAGQDFNLTKGQSQSGQTGTTSALQTDSSRSWSVTLTGEVTLNPAVSFGLVEESMLRASTADKSFVKVAEENTLGLSETLLRLQQVRARKKNFEALVSVSSQLRDKNHRLFEAGELSIDRLIASEQDLTRDKVTFAAIEIEELNLSVDVSLAEQWGLETSAPQSQVMQ